MRLLICLECKSKEPLHDFRGRPEDDAELEYLINQPRHNRAGIRHNGTIVVIPDRDWDNPTLRAQIEEKIDAGLNGGETGLGRETYAMVDTFKEDAMTCFNQHLRNPGCPDYKSDSKRLVPDTAQERKELGMSPAREYDAPRLVDGEIIRARTIYLCDYCPVHSMVQQAARKKAGLYNK